MKKAIPIVMVAALMLAPSVAEGHLYRVLAKHRFVLGVHGMFGIPMTTYKENSDLSNNIYPHFGVSIGYLVSPLYGVHAHLDVNFGFYLNYDDCKQTKCQEYAFKPSLKLYDFGLGVDANISLSNKFAWFLTPEINFGVNVVHWDQWSRADDPQIGLSLRLGLGVQYTFRKRVELRFMVARFHILFPLENKLGDWWGNQAMWEPTLMLRFRF